MVNELMLIVSTISSLLASVAALASELRARRRHRGIANAHDAHIRPMHPVARYLSAASLDANSLWLTIDPQHTIG